VFAEGSGEEDKDLWGSASSAWVFPLPCTASRQSLRVQEKCAQAVASGENALQYHSPVTGLPSRATHSSCWGVDFTQTGNAEDRGSSIRLYRTSSSVRRSSISTDGRTIRASLQSADLVRAIAGVRSEPTQGRRYRDVTRDISIARKTQTNLPWVYGSGPTWSSSLRCGSMRSSVQTGRRTERQKLDLLRQLTGRQ
jgi:hypothetical protein